MPEEIRNERSIIEKPSRSIFQIINDNGVLSSIVASIIFAAITYLVTTPDRKLVYKIKFHEEVLNLEKNPDFSLNYQDSLTIKKNLYLVSMSFWNEGKTPILSQDLRRELIISLDSTDTEILGNLELIESHPTIINTKVKRIGISDKISLGFDFLERGNSIELKFYYISSKQSKIGMDTYITGNKNIEKPSEDYRGILSFFIVFYIWFILMKRLANIPFLKNNKYLNTKIRPLKGRKEKVIGLLFVISYMTVFMGSFLCLTFIIHKLVIYFIPI